MTNEEFLTKLYSFTDSESSNADAVELIFDHCFALAKKQDFNILSHIYNAANKIGGGTSDICQTPDVGKTSVALDELFRDIDVTRVTFSACVGLVMATNTMKHLIPSRRNFLLRVRDAWHEHLEFKETFRGLLDNSILEGE